MKLKFLFLFLAATPVLYAQKFTEVPQSGGPFEGVSRSSIAFADVDGDSDPDILITGSGSSERISTLYTNDGSGTYTEVAGTPFEGVWGSSIAFVDVDGDADPDVLITGGNNSGVYISKLYTNDGSGHFTEVTGTPFEGVWRSSIAFADVDGDGDPDVLLTGRNNSLEGISKLYTNDGSGHFTEVTGTPFEGVWRSSIAFADVDGDGDPDVLLTGQNNSFEAISKLYTNDGTGAFTEVTGTPFQGVYGSSIAFADVDGDGDPDVLITGSGSGTGISKLYTNDGTGTYTEVAGTPFEGVGFGSIAFADVDGDADSDVLLTGLNSSGLSISTLYTNDGSGHFTEVTGTPFGGVFYSSIAFADVDGDGDPDVLITGTGISKLYTNDGSGTYTKVTGTPFQGVILSSIAFADVDGDGDPDVLITGQNNSFEAISKLYTNDGEGAYTEVAGTPFEGVSRSSIAFADVDGDGDPDVLITGQNNSFEGISKLYTNDGTGTFTELAGTPFEGVSSGSIAFADVDGDADPDVLITGSGNSKLYTNDGSGHFTEVTGTPFEGVFQSSIAFADVDGDSDPDVLIAGSGNSKLYTNDGSGHFTEVTGTPFEGVILSSIAFADVDGDSDPDVLITGSGSGSGISKLYTNDGSGTYTKDGIGTPFEGVGYSSIAFADVDGDGDPDVLITGQNNSFEGISKLYTNDGSGTYTVVTGTPFEGVGYSSIAFADVDGDGDPDVLITGRNSSGVYISKLYTNDGTVSSSGDLTADVRLNLTLFPNPAMSTGLNISFHSTESTAVMVRIYDLKGRLIRQQKEMAGTGAQTLLVDITSLSAGSYFIQLENGKQSGVARFIVP